MNRRLVKASLVGAALCFVGRAYADPEPPVFLAVSACPELDEGEVRRIVAAELNARPVVARGPDVTDVEVTCSGAQAVVRVHDPISRKKVQRSFNLGLSDPRARGRLVAIGATELVLASWAELSTNPSPKVEPEGTPPSKGAKRAAVARARIARPPIAPEPEDSGPYEPKSRTWYDLDTPNDRQFRVVGLASARKFFGHDGTLWGGGLRFGEERFRYVSWSADALLETGSVQTRDGSYGVTTTTLGACILLYLRTGRLTTRMGAGLRAGLAGATQGGGAAATLAPWGWPLGAASLTLRATNEVVFDLSGEAGYMLLPVPSDGGEKSIQGAWFAVQFGVGIVPGSEPSRAAARGAAWGG